MELPKHLTHFQLNKLTMAMLVTSAFYYASDLNFHLHNVPKSVAFKSRSVGKTEIV